jgi:hypothetical protein
MSNALGSGPCSLGMLSASSFGCAGTSGRVTIHPLPLGENGGWPPPVADPPMPLPPPLPLPPAVQRLAALTALAHCKATHEQLSALRALRRTLAASPDGRPASVETAALGLTLPEDWSWPIQGGHLPDVLANAAGLSASVDVDCEREEEGEGGRILLTGYADGTLCLWDECFPAASVEAASLPLLPLVHFNIPMLCEKHARPLRASTSLSAIAFNAESGVLAVGTTAGQILALRIKDYKDHCRSSAAAADGAACAGTDEGVREDSSERCGCDDHIFGPSVEILLCIDTLPSGNLLRCVLVRDLCLCVLFAKRAWGVVFCSFVKPFCTFVKPLYTPLAGRISW